MPDLAPWESGDGKQPFHPDAPTEKVPRRAPGRLPEIYKRQTEAFIAPAGNVVPRPQATPRPLEPRAKMAIYALAGAIVAGLAWVGIAMLIFTAEAGAIRYVYASVGVLLAAVAGIILLLELPRINKYRFGTFIPGVLVYGTRPLIEKVVGPAGIGSVTGSIIKGSGGGILAKVFDRSTHKTAPPEIVALHINRGSGAELVGIEWTAVHELQRGDIVWFMTQAPGQYLLFHKLVPYAPWVAQDEATRREVFAALRVGDNMFKDRVDAKNMGTTKVINTDIDGNLVVGGGKPQGPAQPRKGGGTEQLGLSAKGSTLGGGDQYDQSADEYSYDPDQSTGNTHKYKISDQGKPLGSFGQPDQVDNFEE
ncbi:MAG: hypothetical protein H6839_07180 [Planctomycetes bacterium]|nr:hypothetical protein [Planctomycetota bacterium]